MSFTEVTPLSGTGYLRPNKNYCNGKHEGFCGGSILPSGVCQHGANQMKPTTVKQTKTTFKTTKQKFMEQMQAFADKKQLQLIVNARLGNIGEVRFERKGSFTPVFKFGYSFYDTYASFTGDYFSHPHIEYDFLDKIVQAVGLRIGAVVAPREPSVVLLGSHHNP